MENNDLTTTSIEIREELWIDKGEILERQPECCFYNVPECLRKINQEAYTPQVISIGPLHHGKTELFDMEKQKIRYKREFRKRINMDETWQELITFIKNKETDIRKCYEKMPKITESEFISIILYDALFVIELFLRDYEDKSDILLTSHFNAAIREDLQLLENQLPYFVLEELYMLAFKNSNPSFLSLSCEFFWGKNFKGISEKMEVKHFVHLRRRVLTKTCPKSSNTEENVDIPFAIRLKESGLKFRGINENGGNEHDGEQNGGLLDIKFKKNKRRIPWSLVHYDELQIPLIEVYDETEFLFRNVMAFEQCHYPGETYVCNYIGLFDDLINTEEDVSLLVEAGVIRNGRGGGDNATVANMFNTLGKNIVLSNPSCFNDIRDGLKAHYKNRWNHAMATLKSVYFTNYWRGTATVAAIVLLLLTLIQTICSILQLVRFV